MTLTNREICRKNLTDLTFDEFEKVLNTEGFCDPPSIESQEVHVTFLVYYPIVLFCGSILNALVMLTILLRPRLRTVPNAFMISLSTADFLMATVVVPLRLCEFLKLTKSNYVITDILFPLIGVASIFSLCSVTLDRYIHIRNALNYEKYMNKFRAILVVAAIWLFAIFQAAISLLMGDRKKEMLYSDARLIICFCFPGLFIALAYTKLFLVARTHARVIAATTPMDLSNVRSSYKKDFKILKVVVLIVGSFFLCWLPFFVLVSYELHNVAFAERSSVFSALLQISECLVCSTSVLNPILYGFLRRDLRFSIRNVMTCKNDSIEETMGGF